MPDETKNERDTDAELTIADDERSVEEDTGDSGEPGGYDLIAAAGGLVPLSAQALGTATLLAEVIEDYLGEDCGAAILDARERMSALAHPDHRAAVEDMLARFGLAVLPFELPPPPHPTQVFDVLAHRSEDAWLSVTASALRGASKIGRRAGIAQDCAHEALLRAAAWSASQCRCAHNPSHPANPRAEQNAELKLWNPLRCGRQVHPPLSEVLAIAARIGKNCVRDVLRARPWLDVGLHNVEEPRSNPEFEVAADSSPFVRRMFVEVGALPPGERVVVFADLLHLDVEVAATHLGLKRNTYIARRSRGRARLARAFPASKQTPSLATAIRALEAPAFALSRAGLRTSGK